MKLRSAVTPFRRAVIRNTGRWSPTFGSHCEFQSYEFSVTSKKVEKARKFIRRFGGRREYYWTMSNSFTEFATAKVCPAIVHVSSENGVVGSGIIIDSEGTVLTSADNVFPLSKINVSLPDRRNFSGTILQADKYLGLALLKIQSNTPLSITTLGSLENCNGDELISIEHPLRRGTYPRPSSQNEVDEEGICGGPIVNLDGDVVGISTQIHITHKLSDNTWYGSIDAMAIEEALDTVGYGRIGRSLSELLTDEDG